MAVAPGQTVTLFFTKFKSLIGHLRKKIAASASLSLVGKYILVRDAAFFVVDFFHWGQSFGFRAALLQPGFQIKGSGRVSNKIVSHKNSSQGVSP